MVLNVVMQIINISIEYCTNVSEMTLSGESLLIFKYHFNEKNVIIQFSNSQLHFILQKEITLTPGEIHGIGVSFVSNLQVLPEISSDLQDSLALAPEILFKPQYINITNCAEQPVTLPANTILLSLTFPSPQIMGIFRKVDDIMSDLQLD